MMKFKLFVLAILFVTVSLLIVPDLTHTPVSGQADKSFKGTIAPFVPPSSSERLGSLPGNNFEFDDEEIVGDQEEEGGGEEEEIDRDELPVLTKQERDEFLSDNSDAIEADRLTVLSQEETIDDDIDPISSIVEEIVKNETIIGDEEFVPSPESSIIKFKDQNLEQILAAQEVAPEPDNQTISTTEEEELPLNVTEDDFEIEQADEISESESPDVDVQSFINETANEETTTTTAPPTDNETAITTEDTDEEEEEEETTTTTAPPTDNETAITTEDSVEGKPSELLEMDPEAEDEIQDIKGEQQTEQAQQEEEEDEAQTPQVEEEEQQTEQAQQEDEAQTPQVEESPNTEPIAQDGSVTTAQNQQLNIKLNANDADGDDLSFTIVDDPSNGQLGNVNPSTNTVTYTPDEDYSGEDNFTFIVNDGTIDSKEATVSITVEEQQTEQAQQEEDED
ncbi:MAG TPA: Ig-like domain-containing protein [Nitrososphaeraceae archaeon]